MELTSAEIYDPVVQTFSVTGSLINARESPSSALLTNGDVLFAGSYAGPIKLGAELYEPGTLAPPGLESITLTPAELPRFRPARLSSILPLESFQVGPQQLGFGDVEFVKYRNGAD